MSMDPALQSQLRDMSITSDDALEDSRAATELVDAVERHLRVTKFLPIE